MPTIQTRNDDGDDVERYHRPDAMGFTVTDECVAALELMRREAAHDVAFWATHKAALGRFAKDEQKGAQRIERACTIWLRHFNDPGRKAIYKMPLEMAPELDAAFVRMALA
jgi:hypothetical protein